MDLQHAMEQLTQDEQGRFDALFARSGETDRLAYFQQAMPDEAVTLLMLEAVNYKTAVFLRALFGARVN